MIYTSYFAAMRKMTSEQQEKCISIARYMPKRIDMLQYLKVAPKDQILWKYKKDKDEGAYSAAYRQQLDGLDAHEVAADLQNKILLCYEKPSDFCHRHILAAWLRKNGYKCEELKF